ncbi:Cytochrome c biogenesis protein CcdA [Rubritalea squalenifaciens DSM 18772]|uniref:Cytochrome c biogenesis protein CcdA n=1 Tax=Rubritalea squalenifaciens DSM 18772 TaxID=1123071 RepID=A0A1M6ENI6_9BACT|nr:HEAT repeat domain-containing protein [Rubritalea squalenifaciens]SHI87087.1 Cytochrome c biogenesis protein CcdA [Rubritalea squalenifaciens DSM 18772]
MRRFSTFILSLSLACSLRAEISLPENADPASWAEVVAQLSDPELRPQVEKALSQRKHFPRKELVSLLNHPQLAVRIGAIELLEDASGETYDFSPWAEPDKSEDNKTSIELWQRWAKQDTKISKKSAKLSEEQINSYIRNLLSDERSRVSRAIRMLEGDNYNAVSAIQQFIVAHPELPASKLSQLKQAQYELVLIKSAKSSASTIARDLVIGNRDQQLAALGQLKSLGLVTIPIIRDFINSPDALVRETSIDTLISVGGRQVLPFIAEQLKKEKDVNVIHIAIRRVKDIPEKESIDIVQVFLDHKDEDIVVSAISAITKLSAGEDSDFSFNSGPKTTSTIPEAVQEKVLSLLDDPRWRVRVAAVEYVDRCKASDAKDKILQLLKNGKDEYVRSKAIAAAVSLKAREAIPIFEDLYLKHDDLIGSLTPAYMSLAGSFSDKLRAHLLSRDPDTIISAIKAFSGDKQDRLKILAALCTHENLDVACVALRTIANDSDKLEYDFVANVITDAINSGSDEKIQAVLSTLELPRTNFVDPRLTRLINDSGLNSEKTSLDPLYDAFIRPNGKQLGPLLTVETSAHGGANTLKETLVKLAQNTDNQERTFQICLVLTKAGDKRGIDLLNGDVAKMPVSKRASLAESLYKANSGNVISIFKALLQDESSEIRAEAADNALSNENNAVLIQMVLENLVQEDTKLKPSEAYKYRLSNIARNSRNRRLLNSWCKTQLESDKSSDEVKILACILMSSGLRLSDEQAIAAHTTSENQWVRRAAWHCLGNSNSNWFKENIRKLSADKSANVRSVIPEIFSKGGSAWMHYFNDLESRSDSSYSSTRSRRRLSTDAEQLLYDMAKADPSEQIRFEAYFALLTHSRSIDLPAFIALINKQPKETRAVYRLSDHVEDNYRFMGKGMRPLLAYIDFKRISRSKHKPILNHFKSDDDSDSSGFTTFTELAASIDSSTAPQHLSTPEDRVKEMAKRASLILVFFEKEGCSQCAKAIEVAKDLKRDFPLLEIKRFSISSEDGILLNAHLSRVLDLPATADGKVPAFFTSTGYIVPPITAQKLGGLLENTMNSPEQKDWYILKAPEQIAMAKQHVETKYDALTLPIVIAGGLLDGINPCAFATIIFFLSYLTVAKRSPKEIFMVGTAFILAVFLAYLSVGLLFSSFVKNLTENTSYLWLRNALNYVFAGFALLVAVLSFRDYLRARKGKLDEMTLQLPSFLKNRIRGVIRKGAKSSRFVIAAFFSGIAISFLELACTGQVYAPIIYKINQGSADAVSMLVIYNLAFVLPLIVIFALAMGGMKSNALIQFQQKHTAMIKLLTAGLFLLLFVVLIFSDYISGLIKNLQPSISSMM